MCAIIRSFCLIPFFIILLSTLLLTIILVLLVLVIFALSTLWLLPSLVFLFLLRSLDLLFPSLLPPMSHLRLSSLGCTLLLELRGILGLLHLKLPLSFLDLSPLVFFLLYCYRFFTFLFIIILVPLLWLCRLISSRSWPLCCLFSILINEGFLSSGNFQLLFFIFTCNLLMALLYGCLSFLYNLHLLIFLILAFISLIGSSLWLLHCDFLDSLCFLLLYLLLCLLSLHLGCFLFLFQSFPPFLS